MQDDPVSFAANIENLTLTIDEPNRVVINERTGTVIVGNNVRISRVVISHNGIRIAVDANNENQGVVLSFASRLDSNVWIVLERIICRSSVSADR